MGWDGDYVVVTFDDLPLIRRLAKSGPGVIVPSTDAIAEDTPYAQTKREIEAIEGLVVIRSGIVDTRKRNSRRSWFCNPLTPLEWADLAWEKRDQPGVHVAGRGTCSRATVGAAIRAAFGRKRYDTRSSFNSRVQSPDRPRPNIFEAVRQYADWLG